MLAYTVFILGRFSRRYHLARRESRALVPDSWRAVQRSQKALVADLSRGLRTLKGIASAAPFLGLAGTTYWVLGGLFFGYSGSPTRFFDLIEARTASSLLTAAIAILVAIPAIVVHNFLRTRIEGFELEFSSVVPVGMTPQEDQPGPQPFRRAQTLRLQKRFSALPPFALIAGPALASVVAIFLSFEPYETPVGWGVRLESNRCEYDDYNRFIVLRITGTGKLFLNTEEEDWNHLGGRLSAIYGVREDRTLYLFAEDEVPFQTVADAIDIAKNAPLADPTSPNITILLVTPECLPGRLPERVVIGSGRHAPR
jgi:biopolymer transport protein ExbD